MTGCNDLASLIVGDPRHSAAASAKQTMVDLVNRHRDRLLAGGGGPSALNCGGLRVDFDYPAYICEIRIYLPVAG
ncbi:hypothetical protein [Acidicapsa acidisoli]|uniref:hypothetical protein n=1 Tax=Acidicapsa acidisoli TaxID=1615681 RepID=UPI0021DF7467|nr:hypothetical protein [Acidicapsa acidisoli]